VKLTVGASTETVTVTEAPPALETTNATLGATMEQAMYAALPLEMGAGGNFDQRRATDFALLMPGVQGNETNGNATTNVGVINGSGSRGAAAAVYINGIPFTNASGEGDTRFGGQPFQWKQWTSSRSRQTATLLSLRARV
jgi:hypothetical protein